MRRHRSLKGGMPPVSPHLAKARSYLNHPIGAGGVTSLKGPPRRTTLRKLLHCDLSGDRHQPISSQLGPIVRVRNAVSVSEHAREHSR